MFDSERLGLSICRSVLRRCEVRAAIVVVRLQDNRKTNRLTILKNPRTRGFHSGPMRETTVECCELCTMSLYTVLESIFHLVQDALNLPHDSEEVAPSRLQPHLIDYFLSLLLQHCLHRQWRLYPLAETPHYVQRNSRRSGQHHVLHQCNDGPVGSTTELPELQAAQAKMR